MTKVADKEIWLKAAVAGSLWAASEIVIGSFLHNIRFPFTGVVMASAGVILMTAFSVRWKNRGIFWRTGLVCALMKSISPGGIIIGPMIGIMTEALLFQLMVCVMRLNLVGYILGGAGALLSLLLQKVAGLLLMYGLDFVTILDNTVRFSMHLLNLERTKPENILYLLAGLLAVTGILAALTGYWIGYRSKGTFVGKTLLADSDMQKILPEIRMAREKNPGRVVLLFFVFGVIVACMTIFSRNNLLYSSLSAIIFLVFNLLVNPDTLRPLKKTAIWFNFIILLVFSAFLFDYRNAGIGLSAQGVVAGIGMIYRAVVIVCGFSMISRELQNPIIRNFLSSNGFAPLYEALQAGFFILPELMNNLPPLREIRLHPLRSLCEQISKADQISRDLAEKK